MSATRSRRRARNVGFAAMALALLAATTASAQEPVRFPDAAGAEVAGYLTRPRGGGPFPAVVLLHSCLGLPRDQAAIGERFARWGYVALFVDDFATRGLKETCATDFPEGRADAEGALRYLARLGYVDPRRIAAVGYSQGGGVALEIAASDAPPDAPRFKAAAAFYPPCENVADARLEIPTLILVGRSDRVTPAADCERLAAAQPDDGGRLQLVVLPDAPHRFDDPDLVEPRRIYGMTMKCDADAARRALRELRAFLAARLAR